MRKLRQLNNIEITGSDPYLLSQNLILLQVHPYHLPVYWLSHPVLYPCIHVLVQKYVIYCNGCSYTMTLNIVRQIMLPCSAMVWQPQENTYRPLSEATTTSKNMHTHTHAASNPPPIFTTTAYYKYTHDIVVFIYTAHWVYRYKRIHLTRISLQASLNLW